MGEIKREPLRGKKITYAARDRVEEFRELASEFMTEVFDLLPGEYLITDESTLRDFTDFGSADTSPIWSRITETYMVDKADVPSENLLDVFTEIQRRKHLQ